MAALICPTSGRAASLEPVALRCEYRINPQGIDEMQPRLTWQVETKSSWDRLFGPDAHQYRREFSAAKKIKRATIYTTAQGIYDLYLNGRRVGDACIDPGWSGYHQSAYYNTYDVTALVQRGDNAMAAAIPATTR